MECARKCAIFILFGEKTSKNLRICNFCCNFAAKLGDMYKRLVYIVALIVTFLLVGVTSSVVRAQGNQLPGTYGNEFWLSYLVNANVPIEDNPKLYIYAVAEEKVDIIVALGTTGAQLATINIPAGGGVGFTPALTPASVYPRSNEDDKNAYDRGIRIYATDKKKRFTCYAVSEANENTANSTRDATLLLPTEVLGKEYFVQTYPEDGVATEFVVVATEDATSVTVTPTVITAGDHTADQPFTISLNKGQTLLVKSKERVQTTASVDLSGSTICADKPAKQMQKCSGTQSLLWHRASSSKHLYLCNQ